MTALMFGASALRRAPSWGHSAALLSTGFAIFGFVLGLTFTLQGGDADDLAYHATMLPVLMFTTSLLLRGGRASEEHLGSVS